MRVFLNCFLFYIFLLFVIGHFAIIFAYSPVSAGWDLNTRLKPYKALDVWAIFTILSSLYAATDFITWLIPIKIIWGLNLTARRRLSLTFLFGFGGIACAVVVLRTILLPRLYLSFDTTCELIVIVFFVQSNTSLGNSGSLSLCNEVECNVAIIAASLPALNSLFRRTSERGMQYVQKRSHSTPSHPFFSSKIFNMFKKSQSGSDHLNATPDWSMEPKELGQSSLKDPLDSNVTEGLDSSYSKETITPFTRKRVDKTNNNIQEVLWNSNHSVELIIQHPTDP
jgi:hypothetical protein